METEDFKVSDRVSDGVNMGVVHKISDKGVHVKWDNEMFQVFHFNSTHHMQTPIERLTKHI